MYISFNSILNPCSFHPFTLLKYQIDACTMHIDQYKEMHLRSQHARSVLTAHCSDLPFYLTNLMTARVQIALFCWVAFGLDFRRRFIFFPIAFFSFLKMHYCRSIIVSVNIFLIIFIVFFLPLHRSFNCLLRSFSERQSGKSLSIMCIYTQWTKDTMETGKER